MGKEKGVQETLSEMLTEAKRYYALEKQYLRYTAAEQLTKVISALTVAIVLAVVGFVVFIFLGLAVVHWLGALTHNLGLCFAIYGILLLALLFVFYVNRRRWVMLPLARLMTKTFIKEKEDEDEQE
ncbi:MAG: hypothetical protein KBT12_01885 [Bacteroidales bacterium]|nr:hypothetical protein [Candidatus Physcousia equi]